MLLKEINDGIIQAYVSWTALSLSNNELPSAGNALFKIGFSFTIRNEKLRNKHQLKGNDEELMLKINKTDY